MFTVAVDSPGCSVRARLAAAPHSPSTVSSPDTAAPGVSKCTASSTSQSRAAPGAAGPPAANTRGAMWAMEVELTVRSETLFQMPKENVGERSRHLVGEATA